MDPNGTERTQRELRVPTYSRLDAPTYSRPKIAPLSTRPRIAQTSAQQGAWRWALKVNDAGLQDRPIERQEDDSLDREAFVDSLIRSLIREESGVNGQVIARRARGYVIGLTGSWGIGKSSILNLLNLKLRSTDRVVVSLFNPWLFNGRDELLRGFFSELRDAMGRTGAESAQEIVGALDKYWGAIDLAAHASAAFIDLHGAGGVATTGWTKWKDKVRAVIKKPADRSPQQLRRALEQKLEKSKSAVVVLVDELDRVEDDEVRAVAQLIKAIGDIKGISYLVAYDPKRVTEALGRGDKRRGEAYLEKIIQYPIPLRPLFENDVEMLIDAALESHGLMMMVAEEGHQKQIRAALIQLIETPRDVKRLIGAYAILETAVRGEVCPFDVLGYAWIATKAPNLRAAIALKPDVVVDDPGETAMGDRLARQMDKENANTVVDVLGPEAKEMEQLLKLIFPHFAGSHATQPDRIARRRNLIRLLYLGNPPGMVPRVEVEKIWNLTCAADIEAALAKLFSTDRLRQFLDRADDLLAVMEPAQDKLFWPALARLLIRPNDWADGPDLRQAIAADATDSVINLGIRDPKQPHRVQFIMEALIESGDLVLAPSILRKLLFSNGLTKHNRSWRQEGLLGQSVTQSFADREVPRYRAAIEDGTALRRLPNIEAIFVLANLDLWDDALRSNFLAQLQDVDALTTFASLLVPPGHGTEKSTLDELVGADDLAKRIAELREEQRPTDRYLRSSLRRLSAASLGRDTLFDLEDALT